jgi:DNA repair exonuclease SbcCD ATPase subunit
MIGRLPEDDSIYSKPPPGLEPGKKAHTLNQALIRLREAVTNKNTSQKSFLSNVLDILTKIKGSLDSLTTKLEGLVAKYKRNVKRIKELEEQKPDVVGPDENEELNDKIEKLINQNEQLREYIDNITSQVGEIQALIDDNQFDEENEKINKLLSEIQGSIQNLNDIVDSADIEGSETVGGVGYSSEENVPVTQNYENINQPPNQPNDLKPERKGLLGLGFLGLGGGKKKRTRKAKKAKKTKKSKKAKKAKKGKKTVKRGGWLPNKSSHRRSYGKSKKTANR